MKNTKRLNNILKEMNIDTKIVSVIYSYRYKNYSVIQHNSEFHRSNRMYSGDHKSVENWIKSYFSEDNLKKVQEYKNKAKQDYIETGFLKNNCKTSLPSFCWQY